MKCKKCGAKLENEQMDCILVSSFAIFCACIGGILVLSLGVNAHFMFDTYGWTFGIFYVDLLPKFLKAAFLGSGLILILAAVIKVYEE
jgi:hypothetical protein